MLDAIAETAGALPTSMSVSAGSNRIVFLAALVADGVEASPTTAATLGGQSMTKLGEASNAADVATTLWMLNEAGIQAMAGTTLTVADDSSFKGAFLWSIQDADQTITDTNSLVDTYSLSGSLSLARVADGLTFAVSSHDFSEGNLTFTNPPKTNSFVTTNLAGSIGYEASTAETVDWTWSANTQRDNAAVIFNVGPATAVSEPDYTVRKNATGVEITHTLTADGITSQTLGGEAVTRVSQSGQVVTLDFDESAILTSGETNLVLGDGVDTQTFTVQYNVIGLPSNTLLKDGAALASLTDVKLTVLDASGTRLDRQIGLTTDASGLTGVIPVAAGVVDDAVEVSYFSPGAAVGITYETTLGLL
jgi:hypothetical protein